MAEPILKRERVRDYLLELIETHPPGAPIPAERVLCAQLSVSRPTLRSAVDELVNTGLLIRQHGRGTFVAPAKITQELVSADRAMTVPQAGGAWTSRVLEHARIPAGARVGRRLRVSPAAEITYIARLRLVDGAPMAIEYLHVPVAVAPGLTVEPGLPDGAVILDLDDDLQRTICLAWSAERTPSFATASDARRTNGG